MYLSLWLLVVTAQTCLATAGLSLKSAMPQATIVPLQRPSVRSIIQTNILTTPSSTQSLAVPSTTTAPLLFNRFGFRRQECFNDQGFSVNCATWTGYYYTWGPPGNPYEGGPGEGGGSGGGGGVTTTTIFEGGSGTTILRPAFWLVTTCVVIGLLGLWR